VRRRIVLLARTARSGAVKTRLAPVIGERAALELYRAFLEDQLSFLGAFAPAHEVEWCVDREPSADLARLAQRAHVRLTRQRDGDLGQRLTAVFDRSDEGTSTCVVGADSPTLPRALVEAAFDSLARARGAVVVPAEDGGYVLIGTRGGEPALFRDVPWSSARVLDRTRERAREAGLELVEIGRWYDVDDREGLVRLIDELARPEAAARAPATARAILDRSLGRMV
jgi:rSAM/selenodomain-associated transferase 1